MNEKHPKGCKCVECWAKKEPDLNASDLIKVWQKATKSSYHVKGCKCEMCQELKAIQMEPPPAFVPEFGKMMEKIFEEAGSIMGFDPAKPGSDACVISYVSKGKRYSWQIGHTYVIMSMGVGVSYRPYVAPTGFYFKGRRIMAGKGPIPFIADAGQIVKIIEEMLNANGA